MSIQENVNTLIIEDPRCRKSNERLLMEYWWRFEPAYLEMQEFEKLAPAETILRARRRILTKEFKDARNADVLAADGGLFDAAPADKHGDKNHIDSCDCV